MKKINVGILIFNEVEVLDFAGPFEVFSIAEGTDSEKLFNVFTIAEIRNNITARNGLQVVPTFTFNDDVVIDILVIPGGYGAETIEFKNEKLLNWIVEKDKKTIITSSVCTGAIILAEAKLLNHKEATTHWMDLDRLRKDYPLIKVVDQKFVESGKIMTSGGISAGINMSLYIIKKLFGNEISINTAKRMDYDI
ncbi:DJ-1/PfpI family protein [Chryseobacterium sp. RRHN12]|uniref:DJ-1/PfpI family protein n=1 Tax=Chryseobacterium sp. RRHN12 TaxID=3437884 RepID=UPI003D9AFAAC